MILYKSSFILSTGEKIFKDAGLLVKNGTIFDLLSEDQIKNSCNENYAEVIDFGNAVITPGFVNLHTHLQYTDLKPVFKQGKAPENIDFTDWIMNLIKQYYFWSKSKKLKSFKNGLRETVLSGCTCIAQLSMEDFFIDVLNNLDLKSFVFLETFSNSEETSKKEIKKLNKKIQRDASNNVTIGISPHSVYNAHKTLWEEIARFSAEQNILVHTHLAESKDEINWLNGEHSNIDKIHKLVGWNRMKPYETGLNPVEYLEKLGVLSIFKENLTAAHCIELDEKALEKLVNYGTKIAHCPRSNMLLHGKTLDFNKMPKFILQNTGIGTDSKFSNYDLSILNESRSAKDCTGLDFQNLLNMLTINAAHILKIDDKTGSLEKDKDADFLVFKLIDNENYQDILNKQRPDNIFIKGKLIAKNGKFTSKQWEFLNEPE